MNNITVLTDSHNKTYNIDTEAAGFLRYMNVDPAEDIFPQSCRVQLAIKEINKQINKLKRNVNAVYLNDQDYISEYIKKAPRKVVRKKKDYFAKLAVFGVILYVTLGLYSIPIIAIAAVVAVLKSRKNEVKAAEEDAEIEKKAYEMLPKYQKERSENIAKKPEMERELSSMKNLLAKMREHQDFLSVSRDAIPQAYYESAGALLYLYDTHRANTVSEAINVWEQILHQERMEQEQRRQGAVIDDTNRLAAEAKEYAASAMQYAESAAYDAAYAAANSGNVYVYYN